MNPTFIPPPVVTLLPPGPPSPDASFAARHKVTRGARQSVFPHPRRKDFLLSIPREVQVGIPIADRQGARPFRPRLQRIFNQPSRSPFLIQRRGIKPGEKPPIFVALPLARPRNQLTASYIRPHYVASQCLLAFQCQFNHQRPMVRIRCWWCYLTASPKLRLILRPGEEVIWFCMDPTFIAPPVVTLLRPGPPSPEASFAARHKVTRRA